MNFSQFLLVLRARYLIILATLVAVVAITMTITLLLPKTYKATTSLMLNYKGQDLVTGMNTAGPSMAGYMATQVDIITNENVALQVVDSLKLADSPVVQAQYMEVTNGAGNIRTWLAGLLQKGILPEPSATSSNVLDISFKGADPQFVAAIANAFAEAYIKTTIRLRVEPAKQSSVYFDQQIKLLRDEFEAAQNKLSSYQKENNIDNADGRLDVESARLSELSSQLVAAQGMTMEANSRQQQTLTNINTAPDIFNNPLILGLKSSLLASEAKLADLSQRLGVNHPQYQAALSEVEKLRSNLNEQTTAASGAIAGSARIQQQRSAELRAALAAQRLKVVQLNGLRDQLKVLSNAAAAAQRAYEAASLRLTQTSLEASFGQSDISVLNPAKPPLAPSGPNVRLMGALSVFLGLMLGIGLGVVAEIIDRKVRSTTDLTEILGIAVMGEMVVGKKPRHRSLGFGRRSLRHTMNLG